MPNKTLGRVIIHSFYASKYCCRTGTAIPETIYQPPLQPNRCLNISVTT